jgi:hypothetical protein
MLSSADIKPLEMKTLSNGELKILLSNSDDYRKTRVALSQAQKLADPDKKILGIVKYHTYRLHEDKPYTVFIRGLHPSTDIDEITSKLALAGHTVVNIINVLQTKTRVDDKTVISKRPLFKVDLKIRDNNRTVYDINTFCYYSVTVETPRKANTLPQCKRCLDIGHSANYCTKTQKCVRCGDRHNIKDCKYPKSSPSRCANCKGNHTANYKGCPYYQNKISPAKATKISAVDRIKARLAPLPAKSSIPETHPSKILCSNSIKKYPSYSSLDNSCSFYQLTSPFIIS